MHVGGAGLTCVNEGPRPPARPRSRTASSHPLPVGMHTAGIGAAPRTRARFARNKGIRPGASERIRRYPSAVSAARGERSPLASGGPTPTLNQGCATCRSGALLLGEHVRGKGSGCLPAALALATGYVGMDWLVLPAEVPPVVPGKLRSAPGLLADPTGNVLAVRPRECPDRRAAVPLLCHVAHSFTMNPNGQWGGSSHLIRTRSRRGSFHVLATSWPRLGHVLATSWPRLGHVLATSWPRLGRV